MAQVESLPHTQGTQVEFLYPGLSLAHPWLLQAFVDSEFVDERVSLSPSFSPYPHPLFSPSPLTHFLSLYLSLPFKQMKNKTVKKNEFILMSKNAWEASIWISIWIDAWDTNIPCHVQVPLLGFPAQLPAGMHSGKWQKIAQVLECMPPR